MVMTDATEIVPSIQNRLPSRAGSRSCPFTLRTKHPWLGVHSLGLPQMYLDSLRRFGHELLAELFPCDGSCAYA